MKKVLLIALSILTVLSLSSCTNSENNSSASSNATSVNSDDVIFGDEIEDTTQKPEIDTVALAKQISVKKYYYAILVLQNNSDITLDIDVNVEFLNSQKQTVGARDESEEAFAPGTEICLEFSCDTQFSDINYTISVDECEYYCEIDTSLNLETSIINSNKVIAKVTNNGDKSAEFATASCIFLRNDQAVDFDYTYVNGADGLAPGATKSVEISSYEDFDSVIVYTHGRAEK